MTTASNTSALARVVARTRYVLLDFDGPICKVFTDPTASTVAARLAAETKAQGVDTPPRLIEGGPHDVLHFAASMSPELAHKVEDVLRASEVEAAATAQPTPGADQLLKACQQTGRHVAVVSNNAAEAVTAYLERMGFTTFVAYVQGRDPADPSLMKPSPYPIDGALKALGAEPTACTLVGDSVSDIQAAQAAGIGSIGYANKPGKHQRLARAGADHVVQSLRDLAERFSTCDGLSDKGLGHTPHRHGID